MMKLKVMLCFFLFLSVNTSNAEINAVEGRKQLLNTINESLKAAKEQNPNSELLKSIEETQRKEQELVEQQNRKLEMQRQEAELAKRKLELESQAKQQVEMQQQAEMQREAEIQQQKEMQQHNEMLRQSEMQQQAEMQQESEMQHSQINNETENFNNPDVDNQTYEPLVDSTENNQSFFTGFGQKILNFIGWVIFLTMITVPILLFIKEDAKYKKSDGCRKVRDVTDGFIISVCLMVIPLFIYAFAVENKDISLLEVLTRCLFALVLYIAGLKMFVQEAVGYILDTKNRRVLMPASSRDADSFIDYLNPKFWTRYFFREIIATEDLIDVSQRVEESYYQNGKLKLRYILNLTTKYGTYVMKFRSRGKCDSLAHLFIEALELQRYSVTPRD